MTRGEGAASEKASGEAEAAIENQKDRRSGARICVRCTAVREVSGVTPVSPKCLKSKDKTIKVRNSGV